MVFFLTTLKNNTILIPKSEEKKRDKMFDSRIMKRAWAIRKLAALQFACRCRDISWKECLLLASQEKTVLLLTVEKTVEKTVNIGDTAVLVDGWQFVWEGYRRPCTFISPNGERYWCDYGNGDVTTPSKGGMKKATFKVTLNELETFTPVVNYLVSEIERIAADDAFVKRVASESGLRLLGYGSGKEHHLTGRWVDGEKIYYLSEGDIGAGGKIFISVSMEQHETVSFWISGREAALKKIVSLAAGDLEMKPTKKVWYATGNTYPVKDQLKAAGMKWRNGRWESLEKPLVEITGVKFEVN